LDKAVFGKLKRSKEKICSYIDEIRSMESLAQKVTGAYGEELLRRYDKNKREYNNKQPGIIDDIDVIKDELQAEYTEYNRLRRLAFDSVRAIDDPVAQRIIRYRYIRNMKWEDIADKVGLCERQLRNIRDKYSPKDDK